MTEHTSRFSPPRRVAPSTATSITVSLASITSATGFLQTCRQNFLDSCNENLPGFGILQICARKGRREWPPKRGAGNAGALPRHL
jgi:hypothetical protein